MGINWDGIIEDVIKLGIGGAVTWLFTTVLRLKKGMDCAFPRLRAIEKHLKLTDKT